MVPKKLLSIINRLSGWSPVGKNVAVNIDDESEKITSNRQIRARITALTDNGNAVIELENPLVAKEGYIKSLLAVPRHEKYNFDYLWLGGIAVNLFDPIEMDSSNLNRAGPWIAIASLKLIKLEKKESR